jgi:hypothetical protein
VQPKAAGEIRRLFILATDRTLKAQQNLQFQYVYAKDDFFIDKINIPIIVLES